MPREEKSYVGDHDHGGLKVPLTLPQLRIILEALSTQPLVARTKAFNGAMERIQHAMSVIQRMAREKQPW